MRGWQGGITHIKTKEVYMSTAKILQAKVRTEKPQTGIDAGDARQLAEGLSRSLATTYVLYVKTQGFHWNVVGPLFYGLHKLTEEQYKDLAEAADEMAERIRALGHPAPASYAEFLKLSPIDETSKPMSAEDMVGILISDHETAARTFRDLVAIDDKAQDVVTADLLTDRIQTHEEAAWMLRSIVSA
jgi:starvation-inducible DNA-binding protein